MASELTWRQAIDKTLAASATPLHYNEITERIIIDGLRKNLGATPAATVNAQISASIKKDGIQSPYVRVAKATFHRSQTPFGNALCETPFRVTSPNRTLGPSRRTSLHG